MNIQTTKLELIRMIMDVQNESLLERLQQAFWHELKETQEHPERNKTSLSKLETELLKKINEGIPNEILDRFSTLHHKQKREKLSSKEEKELFALTDSIESKEAERLEKMLQLANLWQVSLEQVRERLGIKAPEPYVW